MMVGRQGMFRHNVFKVHDIPPAAYFAGDKPFKQGDVCSMGLWDEAVDEPIAYPFVAGETGFCYLPNFKVEPLTLGPVDKTPQTVVEQKDEGCTSGCKLND